MNFHHHITWWRESKSTTSSSTEVSSCSSCWWKNWGSISSRRSRAAQKVVSVLFTYFSFKKGGLFVGSPIMRTQDHIHPSESCWSILCIKTLRNGGCYCCCCRGLWGWCWVCTNRAPSLREHRRLQQRRLLSGRTGGRQGLLGKTLLLLFKSTFSCASSWRLPSVPPSLHGGDCWMMLSSPLAASSFMLQLLEYRVGLVVCTVQHCSSHGFRAHA